MRNFGEDANRLALALDKAEAGSDLEREIIHSFLERFAVTQRLNEAQWWNQTWGARIKAKVRANRLAELEAERQGKGEQPR